MCRTDKVTQILWDRSHIFSSFSNVFLGRVQAWTGDGLTSLVYLQRLKIIQSEMLVFWKPKSGRYTYVSYAEHSKHTMGLMLEKEFVWVKWMLVRVLKDGDAVAGEKETVSAAQTSSFTGGMMCFLGYLHALGEGHGNPLQYSWLENLMDRGTWQTMVHRVTKNWTQVKWLSMHTC